MSKIGKAWFRYIGRNTQNRLKWGTGKLSDEEVCRMIAKCSEMGALRWVNDDTLESILIGNSVVCSCEDYEIRKYIEMCSPDRIALLLTRLVDAEKDIIKLKREIKRGVVEDVHCN